MRTDVTSSWLIKTTVSVYILFVEPCEILFLRWNIVKNSILSEYAV